MRELKRELWPYVVMLNIKESDPVAYKIELWLDEICSRSKDRWYVVYRYDRSDFYFKDEYDATAFRLKWL